MNKHQLLAVGAALLLVFILLFAFDTKSPKLKQQEQERALNLQATSINILREEAMASLSGSDRSAVQILRGALQDAEDDDTRIEAMSQLSRKWFSLGQYGMAGYYAEEIANIKDDGESWAIAGTTYGIGVTRSDVLKEKEFCRDKAIAALDNANSIDPDVIDHQINKAIILAELPLRENPMKGILILLDLNKKYPENVSVMNNLAKFALRTNQTDKALVRLQTALGLDPDNRMTNCLLSQLYTTTGDTNMAADFKKRCEELK